MKLRKILCPIDFSTSATAALHVAAGLARTHDCELVVMHVWDVPPTPVPSFAYSEALLRSIAHDATRGLERAVTEVEKLGIKRVTSKLAEGATWQMIASASEAMVDLDLIVIGTHGRTGLARIVLGSVAEMVVRHAACSVLAVPQDASTTGFHHAIAACDFSPASRHALALAQSLAPTTAMTLCHVIEPPAIYGDDAGLIGLELEELHALEDRSREALARWASELGPGTTTVLRSGNPARELRALLAERTDCDLVALGSHGRTGLRRALLGSVAETIVRHAQRAVLVARERSKHD